MLTFNAERHEYHWNGKPVPGVTRALGDLTDYSFVKPDALERARQEGEAIHAMVELYLKDDLDEDTLPAWLAPRLAALKKLIADTQFKVRASEKRVYHPTYGYAGTLDLTASMIVGSKAKAVEALLDVKRSFAAGAAIGLQLAAYQAAENAGRASQGVIPQVTHRYALQLRADGSYRLELFEDSTDFMVFLACLTRHKWKDRHGKH